MKLSNLVPAPIDEVFEFVDDPTNVLTLGGHAAEHVAGIDCVEALPDGRRTFDIHMRAGGRTWTQTVAQVVRERPTRLVTRGWTWVEDRDDPYLVVLNDRQLASHQGGTRLDMTVTYERRRRSILALVANWMRPDAARLELEHQLHGIAEHFSARDIREQ